MERPKPNEIQPEVKRALLTLLFAASAFGLLYLASDREDNEEVINFPPGRTADLAPGGLLESRYGICLSTINHQIESFHGGGEETINSIEIVPLSWKGDLRFELGRHWQMEESEPDGKFLFGGRFDSQELLKLVENLPPELVTKALVFVNFEAGQDVLLQGKIGEEEVCLKATGLITDQNQPQIPTWVKVEKEGFSLWNPEKGQWESSF